MSKITFGVLAYLISLNAFAYTWDGTFSGQLTSSTGQACYGEFYLGRYHQIIDIRVKKLECAEDNSQTTVVWTNYFPSFYIEQFGRDQLFVWSLDNRNADGGTCGFINTSSLQCDSAYENLPTVKLTKAGDHRYRLDYFGNRDIHFTGELYKK